MRIIRTDGTVRTQTTVVIAETLHHAARQRGISLSRTLSDALVEKFEQERKAGAPHVAKRNAPAIPSPYHKENET